jgi:hypothetical protein
MEWHQYGKFPARLGPDFFAAESVMADTIISTFHDPFLLFTFSLHDTENGEFAPLAWQESGSEGTVQVLLF